MFDCLVCSFDIVGNRFILYVFWDIFRNYYSGIGICFIFSIFYCVGILCCFGIDFCLFCIYGIGLYMFIFLFLEDMIKSYYRDIGRDCMLCSFWCG